ncbi:MAG: 3-deoxy-D-manno-octulosonic acid transferase, partial [Gammaproteobacteria bacterium]
MALPPPPWRDPALAAYSLAVGAALPLALGRLAWRGLRAPGYRRRWGERLGWRLPAAPPGAVWVHACSVGEVEAAAALVGWLLERAPVLLTTTTPTGSARARALFGERVSHAYLPFDRPGAMARWVGALRPRLLLLMETELWPNLLRACARAGVPAVLANARLSARSARGYRRLGPLTRAMLGDLRLVAAQEEADGRRFLALGLEPARLRVTGSLKYDRPPPPGAEAEARRLRRAWGEGRPVLLAASTHPPEEAPVAEAFAALLEAFPEALLLWAPRHPERFGPVAARCTARGWAVARRSAGPPAPGAQVYLADTLGELPALYAAADAAFVGGSLFPHGGHNPLEAAVLGVPVAAGPHTFNFAGPCRALEEAGA